MIIVMYGVVLCTVLLAVAVAAMKDARLVKAAVNSRPKSEW